MTKQTTKQPTLKQLDAAAKAGRKADTAFDKVDLNPNSTQTQYDAAKARVKKAEAKYWVLVEAVTPTNKDYAAIIHNGHYEC